MYPILKKIPYHAFKKNDIIMFGRVSADFIFMIIFYVSDGIIMAQMRI